MAAAFRTAGTPYDSAAASVTVTGTITVPAGVVPADWVLLLVAWSGVAAETPPTVTPSGTGWVSVIAPRTENNSGWTVLAKTGLSAGDTFTVALGNTRLVIAAHFYYQDTSGPGTPGAVTGRAGVSVATTTAATSTPTESGQTVAVLSTERTAAAGTTVSSIATATSRSFYEATGSSACSALCADFTGPTPAAATAAVTVTYSGASGNGAAVQVPMLAAGAGPTLTRATQALPGADRVRCSALTLGATSVRMAVSTVIGMASPVFGAAQVPDAQGYSKHEVAGLVAATDYYWQMELDGTLVGAVGRARTFPTVGTAASFSFAAAACSLTGSADAVFTAIRTRTSGSARASFLAHMGDMHYAHSGGGSAPNDPADHRSNYEAALGSATQAPLYRDVPLSHSPSDNDFCGSNTDSTAVGRPAFITARRQMLADPTLPDTGGAGLWTSWVVGRVRFIRTDSRTYMSLRTATDDAAKSMLGAEQKAWLKAQLSAAEPVKVWFHDNAWGAAPVSPASGVDTWQVFSTERAELAAYITANSVRVLYVHGDAHRLSADNGTNNAYGGFPMVGCAPLDQDAQHTQPVTVQQSYPAAGTADIAGAHLYGWFDVTDTGTELFISCQGYDAGGTKRIDLAAGWTGLTPPGAGTGTLTGLRFAWFGARAAGTTMADRERAYFAGLSGLPAGRSLADHKRAYYGAQLGLSATQLAARGLTELEMAYWASQGATGASWGARARSFYGSG